MEFRFNIALNCFIKNYAREKAVYIDNFVNIIEIVSLNLSKFLIIMANSVEFCIRLKINLIVNFRFIMKNHQESILKTLLKLLTLSFQCKVSILK